MPLPLLLDLRELSLITGSEESEHFMLSIIKRIHALELTKEESVIVEALCFMVAGENLSTYTGGV